MRQYKLVITNGFKRAGSIWQYEVARMVMERTLNAKILPASYDWNQKDFFPEVWDKKVWEPHDCALIKVHAHITGILPLVCQGLVKILLIYRDPRDAYCSAITLRDRRPGERPLNPPVYDFLNSTVRNYWSLKSLPNVLYQKYEHMVQFPIYMVWSIARLLGVFVSFEDAKEIAEQCSPKGVDNRYPCHVSNRAGRSYWRGELDPKITEEIHRRYREWMIDAGYPLR